VKVIYGTESLCGRLDSADAQEIPIKPDGASKSTRIPFAKVSNLFVVDEC
jgi:hypothetical protein